MAKNIILHIGLPKSASSTLQNQVFPRLDNCAYFGKHIKNTNPVFAKFSRRSHYESQFMTLVEKEEVSREATRVLRNSSCGSLLLSDEHWAGFVCGNFMNRDAIVRCLSETFEGAQILIIVRRQPEWIESLYYEMLKTGMTITIEEFIRYDRERDEFLEHYPPQAAWPEYDVRYFPHGINLPVASLNWKSLVESFDKVFGEENVHVMFFEELIEIPKIFLQRISTLTKSSVLDISALVPDNASMPFFAKRVMRLLNYIAKTDSNHFGVIPLFYQNPNKNVGHKYFKILADYCSIPGIARLISSVCRQSNKSGAFLKDDVKDKIIRYHSDSNTWLVQRAQAQKDFGYTT